MTQRIKELLDEAVAGVEPDSHDPVAAVVRRGRRQRGRVLTAGALVLAVLAGGGLALGRRASAPDPAPPAAVTGPSTPHLVGRTVVAADLWLPVPDGWTVVTNDPARPCRTLTDTILLVTTNNRGCEYAPVEVYGIPTVSLGTGGNMVGDLMDHIASPAVSATVRGGEPVWMMYGFDEEMGQAPEYDYWNVLTFPWSTVSIQLRLEGPLQRQVVESMLSDPPQAGTLVLPATAATAELTAPDAAGRLTVAGHRKTTDRATIDAALTLLRSQTAVVDDTDACATDKQHTARLLFDRTAVLVTLGTRCQEAVSSGGGRVRLSDATVTELKRLFGIGAR